jgi:hypothetical protein
MRMRQSSRATPEAYAERVRSGLIPDIAYRGDV